MLLDSAGAATAKATPTTTAPVLTAKEATHGGHRAVDRLKLENGYIKGVKDFDKGRGGEKKTVGESSISININGGGGGGADADELFDGWPKWLVDNIPSNLLSGLLPKTADSYDKLAKIGKGTYSNVYKARDKSNGKIVALKKVRFDTSEAESVKFMAREIIILKKLDHPNIIKLEGIATSRMQCSLYLVFDFMPSDLTKLITQTDRRLTEQQVKCYLQQLLSGLQHCHKKGILHRDIKGSNLLIDKNGILKIADFGLANFYKNKPKRPLTTRVVTLWYRAPELLLGSTDYGVGIDLWSAGCLLAEMFVGRPIMPGRNEIEQLHKIYKLCGSPSEDFWKTVKPPATFRPPQQYKANFKETFSNIPDAAIGLLGKLLALDPGQRGDATSALNNQFFTVDPLPCDISGLPVIVNEEDAPPIQSINGFRNIDGKQQSKKTDGTDHPTRDFVDTAYAKQIRDMHMARNFMRQETETETATGQSSKQQEITRSQQNQRSAITEAHPNALKNIKNYPLLLASLTEAAHHLEESKSSLYRRSISNIDFRNLDIDKISKLFGLEEEN
ncbi:probable serine/threonine-protein kinase At1g54610 [Andrographis paniculata]|uniref:probable serine/threonine-protein kinase At1g54610 n=1 Tax=Andrographis paniculata TaxID=175694 RepID=UPI0021E8243E|nr:probable serine/threonine-protein kinase At1g54610 [Andrographis paniculata]